MDSGLVNLDTFNSGWILKTVRKKGTDNVRLGAELRHHKTRIPSSSQHKRFKTHLPSEISFTLFNLFTVAFPLQKGKTENNSQDRRHWFFDGSQRLASGPKSQTTAGRPLFGCKVVPPSFGESWQDWVTRQQFNKHSRERLVLSK